MTPSSLRQQAQQDFRDGNYKDAYEKFRKLALEPTTDPRLVGQDLEMATQCLERLNRVHEIDAFREAVIQVHRDNWRLLWAAARNYMRVMHHGFMVAGQFRRGPKRGGGQVVNAQERDRVRALQLMDQARPLARQDDNHTEVAAFYQELANILLNNRGWHESWRLQYLTDLSTLPDYEPGWGHYRQQLTGAPVDEEGHPVYHHVPRGWKEARTDGERWRWCLVQAMEFDPRRAGQVTMHFADFLWNQFGVQTMAHFGWFFGRMETDDTRPEESGTYALHTLEENETIARLATGIKRFTLPEEFNFIKLYRQVAEKQGSPQRLRANERLGQIFENRRQYPRAAEYWRRCIELSGQQRFRDRLAQIVDNWGRFENVQVQPAGRGATVEYRFRNGQRVQFTAHEVLVDKLLEDVKAYLKSRPGRLDWNQLNIANIGHRLVQRNEKKYRGRLVAAWDLDLEPRPDHFDKRITVTTPLQKAGVYLLTAEMEDGNTCHIILWLADLAIAKKPLDGKTYYFVADAVTGQPIPKANVEFFGYRQVRRGGRRFDVLIHQFAEYTDADGQVITDPRQQPQNYQWIVIARTEEGRMAYLGFTGVWYGRWYDQQYNQVKVYTITDRPVYRPKQAVHYKFWVRRARYDKPDTSEFAGQTFTVEIHNPKGERVVQKDVKADEFGGIEGRFELPEDATLGVWRLSVLGERTPPKPARAEAAAMDALRRIIRPKRQQRLGGGTFRVEEYKKPEFEVTVEAPAEPVMLGEKIEVTIKARYYFGSPVAHAKVKYRIQRTGYTEHWYPVRPWDWLYGPGYWWYASDYDWYPGWRRWGCPAPPPFWWPVRPQPPELVAEQEVEIGPEGTVKVQIDTSVAKAIHPDQDHRYTITAEVVDQSRRTIVGTGQVLVARQPFRVYAWTDRGYYRVGDVIKAQFAARTLDGKPVQGKGKLTLLAIRYKDAKPVETPVQTWELATNEQGRAELPVRATRAGQYRLSYQVTDSQGHTIEGGHVFTIIGSGFDSADFRFNDLELVPDKAEYQPGETVKLMVNTNRAGSTVLLFVRPANGVYLPPQVLRLEGKSTIHEIKVARRDMPNFFVEAVTISDGRIHSVAREIAVPPEKRVLSVEVEPSSKEYRPGEKATVKLTVKDFHGKPFVGSAVVAIYDKSVEYISGGSNVADIKAFFWKWRRSHSPRTECTLQRGFGNLNPPKTKPMQNLGIFGATVPEEPGPADGRLKMQRAAGFGGARAVRRARAPTAPMADAMEAPRMAEAVAMEGAEEKAEPAALVEPAVRTQFADTALWVGDLVTDGDGTAVVSLQMPENLTTWRIKVWGMGHGTKVGEGVTDVVTRKDLIVRLQAPRFFIEKDEVVLSANVHNYLDSEKAVQVALELDGDVLQLMEGHEAVRTVRIAPEGEARVDWRVRVTREGEAVVRMKALTDEESDAMEMRFPAYVHGMLKMESWSGALRPEQSGGKFTVTVPAQRRPEQSRLVVQFSPTLAGAMVDALPFLVNYPYGCTEQTLNRFLPTVITQKILIDMGLDLEQIKQKRVNLNPQELGDPQQRAEQWKRYKRNPVFDQDEVRRMVKEGVRRLTEMQLSDGGWGWFSGYGERSSAHTTALVVHGLQIARQNDVALVPGVLQRGVQWLKRHQDEQVRRLNNALKEPKERPWKSHADNLDAFVYMVLVDEGISNDRMREFLYRDRTQLAVYGMAMYGLALHKQGEKEKLDMILRNISQYVVTDDENQTAWLNLPDGYWWYWYGSEFEAHAYYLKLLARTDPQGRLAPRLVKYLLNNRKHATYWNSTRDTALCIEAMADFLRASGEAKPEMTVQIWMDGELQKSVEITSANLFQFDNSFVLSGDALTTGDHVIELKKQGRGPLYYNAYLTNFTLEDYITRAGLEIKVQRRYYRLKPVEKSIKVAGSRGQAVDQRVEKYERVPMENLATLESGQLVEIELEIQSKNDYEYLVFEDMKPAGFEPVDLRSGYTGNPLGAYMEFRDNRVVFFVSRLARGRHSVAYRMRAEIPGRFSALPTRAWAMYAPELKANSDEIKLQVTD
ncbi:MAG TPA: alpha-2-macroglobulin [Planctomycetaceae bacterium]|nr:alpha-2-macroglobulin [Planctomycetaceae bacterium]